MTKRCWITIIFSTQLSQWLRFSNPTMNPSKDHLGITKNSILSKKLIEHSRRLIKELEVLIKQRKSDDRQREAPTESSSVR